MAHLRGVAVGAGYFSRFHYDAWGRIPEVALTAVCDLDAARAATAYPGARPYTALRTMLEPKTQGPAGQWVLLALKAAAVLLLWFWLAHAKDRLTALALGLIIGGAIGNAIDRLAYGWVADFVFFHISTATWRFNWYVFNLADVAIVAGVIGLLYESLVMDRAAKAP